MFSDSQAQHRRDEPEEGMDADRDAQELEAQVVRGLGHAKHRLPRWAFGGAEIVAAT